MFPLNNIVKNWSTLINILIQKYLLETTSVCILWNDNIDIQLESQNFQNNLVPIISISRNNLAASLERDIYNFTPLAEKLEEVNSYHDELVGKLTASIEKSHCEGFIAFQEDIPLFTRSFRNASTYSIWRSERNKFIFAYRLDLMQEDYFTDYLFQDQPNILIVEAENLSSTIFNIKTNKFVGSLHEHPEQLFILDRFNAADESFEHNVEISTTYKIRNLMGREVIMGGFDYRPFVVLDYDIQPQVYDHGLDNPNKSIHLDGTETRIVLTFCQLYNCTVQFDSTETGEWGFVYPNYTASGLKGLMIERKTHIGLDAMYTWRREYEIMDMTTFVGRSGVTCLVPAPTRLTSWSLPLKPFEFTLWLGVAACLLLETLSLLVTRQMENTLSQAPNNSWYNSFEFGYSTTLKLFISQGSDYVVNSTSVRTVLFSCYMIDIIITSIYGGGLASILTIPTLGEAADSLERLHKQKLLWTATSEDWILSLKGVTDDPIIVDLVNNFRVFSFDEMRQLARSENMGFVLERLMFGHFGNGNFITTQALDRLKLMVDDIYYQYTVGFVPRLWPFLAKFNSLVYTWHSSGFSKYWEWKVTADYLNENEQQQVETSMKTNFDTGPVELGMANFAGLILVWLVGTAVSILAFILEMWYFHKWQQKNIKQRAIKISKLAKDENDAELKRIY